jgi:hypothetical protein
MLTEECETVCVCETVEKKLSFSGEVDCKDDLLHLKLLQFLLAAIATMPGFS